MNNHLERRVTEDGEVQNTTYYRHQRKDGEYRVGQTKNGRKICGARKKDGGKCGQWPLENGRCRIHGGKAPAGMANPNFVHGRHSKYIPGNLLQKYEESLNDPQLVQLRDEIALLDTRIKELTEEVGIEESPVRWRELHAVWAKFVIAARQGDEVSQQQLFGELDQMIRGKFKKDKAWRQIQEIVAERRRLVDVEARRMRESEQFMSIEQIMVIMTLMIATVREAAFKYAEPDTAQRILVDAQASYTKIVGQTSRSGTDGRDVVDADDDGEEAS